MRYTNTIAQKLAAITVIAAAFAGVFAQTETRSLFDRNTPTQSRLPIRFTWLLSC